MRVIQIAKSVVYCYISNNWLYQGVVDIAIWLPRICLLGYRDFRIRTGSRTWDFQSSLYSQPPQLCNRSPYTILLYWNICLTLNYTAFNYVYWHRAYNRRWMDFWIFNISLNIPEYFARKIACIRMCLYWEFDRFWYIYLLG